jgi:hypothetical protein
MKIGPEPPPPVPAWPAPPAAEPATPFTEFLADSEARAAGFAELGMFGRNRAQSGPGPAPAPAANPGDPPPPTRALATLPEDGTATQLARVNRTAPAPLPSSQPPLCDLPDAPAIKAKPAEACSLPTEAPGRTRGADRRAGPAGPARSPTPRARPRQDAPRTAVNLAIRETDGAVEIVAGAPPIDPEARVQLRRLIEAILARSGLALAQFQLNGAPLAPDNLGKTGGTHGTRTR